MIFVLIMMLLQLMIYEVSKLSISDKRNVLKLKLTNYNVMLKIDKQDLIDITDIKKNTGLSDKNGVTNMSYILSTKVL